MENAGGEDGVGFAFQQHGGHMFEVARPAAGHDGHADRFADATRDDEVEASAGAVGINAVQHDFASAECHGASGPIR